MKRGNGTSWTDEEKGLLLEWMKDNPGVKTNKRAPITYLMGLLPNRTWKQIAAMEYYERFKKNGSKPLRETEFDSADEIQELQNRFYSMLHNMVYDHAKVIAERIISRHNQEDIRVYEEQISKLKEENERLKGLLRKLTKVREAIEEFKL